jgi:hypothetical protein
MNSHIHYCKRCNTPTIDLNEDELCDVCEVTADDQDADWWDECNRGDERSKQLKEDDAFYRGC